MRFDIPAVDALTPALFYVIEGSTTKFLVELHPAKNKIVSNGGRFIGLCKRNGAKAGLSGEYGDLKFEAIFKAAPKCVRLGDSNALAPVW